MREKLNLRFLLVVVATGAVLASGWTAVHAYQVRRNTNVLLANARKAAEANNTERALRLLGLYLDREPGDLDAREQYARILDGVSKLPQERRRVIDLMEGILERDPKRLETRRRIAELGMQTGLFDTAERHLEVLRQTEAPDAKVLFQLGVCHETRNDLQGAADLYSESIELQPDDLNAAIRLAGLHRRLNNAAEADKCLDAMVAANPNNYKAYLARANEKLQDLQNLQFDAAEKDVTKALQIDPKQAETLLLAAEIATRLSKPSDITRGYLQQLIEIKPDDPRGYELLAALEVRDNNPEAAITWLRKGLEQLPANANLLWNEANLLISTRKADEAREVVKQLTTGSLPFGRIEFLKAALQVLDHSWREAAAALETIRPVFASEPDLALQADLLLGDCYRNLSDYDKAVAAYMRVVGRIDPVHPFQPLARYGIVISMFSQGQTDDALMECEKMMKMPRHPVKGWSLLGQLLILKNLRLPEKKRTLEGTWEGVNKALKEADNEDPNSSTVTILRAEALVGEGKPDEARKLLKEACANYPKEIDYRIALAELADRLKDKKGAAEILEKAAKDKDLGDSVKLRLARARQIAGTGSDETVKQLVSLADGADNFAPGQRLDLLARLANILQQLDRPRDAKGASTKPANNGHAEHPSKSEFATASLALWKKVTEMDPRTLAFRLAVFDLAYKVDDEELMAETLTAMREIEGADGPLTLYNQARQLMSAAKNDNDPSKAAAARVLLTEVAAKRPQWSRVHLAMAHAYEIEENPDRAIESYSQAIKLGERQLEAVLRLVDLLFERRRFAEADAIIRLLPEQTPVFANLQTLADLSLKVNDHERALEYALKAVPADSKNPFEQRWLGQIYAATGNHDKEAEAALIKSRDFDKRDPAGWVALVQFYARTKQNWRAKITIAEAISKIDKNVAPISLAQCYLAIGDYEKARSYFNAALAAQPNDANVLSTIANFELLTGRRAEAIKLLRKIVESNAADLVETERARRLLAVLLAADGNYADACEALALVGVSEGNSSLPSKVEDQRARATVLAAQPRKSQRLEAIRILEEVNKRHPLSAEDQYLLVQLYERVGDINKARDQMLSLLAYEGDNPRYLAHQIRSLLDRDQLHDAQLWVEKLEQAAPDALPTIELKVRLLTAQKRENDALDLLKKIPGSATEAPVALYVASLLEELNLQAAAEEYYRSQAKLAAGKPEAALELARFLGRRGKLEEALRICQGVGDTVAADTVGYAYLTILRAAKAGDSSCRRVESLLKEAQRKNPKSIGLLICLADLQELRKQYAEAERLYRQVLTHEPNNLVALNNLAWLLALQDGKAEEALVLANRALEIAGPLPALLDTHAVTLLANKKAADALADLDDAFSPGIERTTLASIRFHQARAYLMANNNAEAVTSFQDATKRLGLDESAVHPLEMSDYKRLSDVK